MIKAYIKNDECKEFEFSGSPREIAIEVSTIIGCIYSEMKIANPKSANLFKEMFEFVWSRKHIFDECEEVYNVNKEVCDVNKETQKSISEIDELIELLKNIRKDISK